MGIGKFFKKLGIRIRRVFKPRKKRTKVKGRLEGPGSKRLINAPRKPKELVAPETSGEFEIAKFPEIDFNETIEKGGISNVLAAPKIGVFTAIDEFSGVQLSLHTQRAYKRDLDDFFSYLKLQGLWESWNQRVTPLHIAQYRMHLIRNRKLAKASVTRKLAVLKSFYRWSVSRGWLQHNPAELVRSFPQTQESKTGYLSEKEIDRVLGHFGEIENLGLHQALSKTIIESLLMLGVRRSEAAKMTAGDLEYMDARWLVRIRGKGDRDRVLPLPPRLLKTWSSWLHRIDSDAPAESLDTAPESWIDWARRNRDFPILISTRAKRAGIALSTSELARIVRKSCRKAGLINRVSPHMLRASAITHALDQGASHRGVQQMAGWTSPLMITRYDKRRKDPRYSAVLNLNYAKWPPTPADGKLKTGDADKVDLVGRDEPTNEMV